MRTMRTEEGRRKKKRGRGRRRRREERRGGGGDFLGLTQRCIIRKLNSPNIGQFHTAKQGVGHTDRVPTTHDCTPATR